MRIDILTLFPKMFEGFINESIIKRARNHKSHGTKSADIITYKRSTGLEALIGYLSFKGFNGRIKEIMDYIVGD